MECHGLAAVESGMLDDISMWISKTLIILGLILGVPLGCLAMVMGAVCGCIHEGWLRGYRGTP